MTTTPDCCTACDRPFRPDQDDQLWAFRTPPASTTAALVEVCDDVCLAQLDTDDWHPSTETERDRLQAEVAIYGHRLADDLDHEEATR